MTKKTGSIVLSLLLACVLALSACEAKQEAAAEARNIQWFQYFDTVIQITVFTESVEKFTQLSSDLEAETLIWHELLDKYQSYPNVNNVHTLNERAGREPVEVDPKLIDILQFGKEIHQKSNGQTNIALGTLTDLWQSYRDAADESKQGELPTEAELTEASKHIDINDLIIDEAENTVFFADPELKLDLGAIAKGYVTEWTKEWLLEQGFSSVLLNYGGNLHALGAKPGDESWKLGIKNPPEGTEAPSEDILKVLLVKDQSVVTSGNYERYYLVGERHLNHIIDPDTAYPGNLFRQVSLVGPNSAWGDALSTALFNQTIEEGQAMLESFPGMAACWVTLDGELVHSDNWSSVVTENGR